MRLGAGVTYHPNGLKPRGDLNGQTRIHVAPFWPQRQSGVKHPRSVGARSGMAGFGDTAAASGVQWVGGKAPLQGDIEEINRAFNAGGFTPASILPVLQVTAESTARQIGIANASSVGGYIKSDAANNDARAQRMLAQMQAQANAGDATIYSNPSATWSAVKDAVLGPYYLISEYADALDTQLAADRQIPGIIATAIVQAPSTIVHAVADVAEKVKDAAQAAMNINIPRWAIWGAGGLAVMLIARPYVSPILRRL